jgi:hypothetical protein
VEIDGIGRLKIASVEILETTGSHSRIEVFVVPINVEPGIKILGASGTWEELRRNQRTRLEVLVQVSTAEPASRR